MTEVYSTTQADAHVAPIPGEVIAGRWRVESLRHESKHAFIVAATTLADGEPRVLKILRTGEADDPRPRRRMAREADLLLRIEHPNIVRLHDVVDDPPLLELELVGTRDLRAELKARTRLPVRETWSLARQLADAAGALHAAGWIHADIKPANVLVRDVPDGDPTRYVLADFHLSRAPGVSGPGLGTRLFAAPEQAVGGALTAAVDAWGIGVVLYRAATGRLPFTGKDGQPQLDRDATSAALFDGVPDDLAEVIDGLLTRDPTRRLPVRDVAISCHAQ